MADCQANAAHPQDDGRVQYLTVQYECGNTRGPHLVASLTPRANQKSNLPRGWIALKVLDARSLASSRARLAIKVKTSR